MFKKKRETHLKKKKKEQGEEIYRVCVCGCQDSQARLALSWQAHQCLTVWGPWGATQAMRGQAALESGGFKDPLALSQPH